MTKYYTGGSYTNAAGTMANGYYVFGSVRGPESQSNIHATFTTADHYSGPVTVVNESRTVQATNGVFTDTFATAASVHIYEIADSSIAVSPSPTTTITPTPSGKTGDLNKDGQVNIFDLSILLSHWGTADATSDVNHDGTVNIFDLSTLLSHWGT